MFAGHSLQRFVDFRVGFHGADFVREDVAVEIGEERKVPANMNDRQIIRVRENVSGNPLAAQGSLDFNHGRNFPKDVGKESAELLDGAAKAGGLPHFLEEFLPRHQSGFIAVEQGRVVEEFSDINGGPCGAFGDFAGGDGIIEIHQHFAEIEDDDGGSHRMTNDE